MSRVGRRERRRRPGQGAEAEEGERWLLTYADMITLLMALFMVMFSISSVNKAKFETLQRTLKEAFSGQILPGADAIKETGAARAEATPSPTEPPIGAITVVSPRETGGSRTRAAEEEDFARVKREVDSYSASHGLAKVVATEVSERGLVIRLLTDRVLFDSGQAFIKPAGGQLLGRLARMLRAEVRHPIVVEGHTDAVPIGGGLYPTNWELSTARASSVVRAFARGGVNPRRMAATGYASLQPMQANTTASGRARNRRVEIVLLRMNRAQEGRG